MFLAFLDALRAGGIPASLTEHLALLQALRAGQPDTFEVEDFYALARATYCRDETQLDRFDRIFGAVFRGALMPAASPDGVEARALPEEWLRQLAQRHLTPEEMAKIEALGGWEALMEALRQRLAEQRERHEGGSKWIGTGGTSPFGAHGYNPEGVNIGQGESRHRRAVKVWDERRFRDLDDQVQIGTRQIKVALRRLRQFAREGAAEELDLDDTIRSTARQGWLDVRLRPERHNAVKLLLLLDVGGSMDEHVRLCEELFSAARAEFRHLEFFYFHNCPYERLWKENRRRHSHATPTWDVINTYGRDWRLLFVGDASMSPYELTMAGGSVEHMNPEPGLAWLERMTTHWERAAWLNPVPEAGWQWTQSTEMVREALGGRMFPLTLAGLEAAMRALSRRG
jgi:uncharacterized protein with von Willebrand factor type A (vWA) domain